MAFIITCECGKKLKLKDEHAGKKLRCPHCKSVIVAEKHSTSQSENNVKRKESKTKECQDCGELILERAKKCKHCGSYQQETDYAFYKCRKCKNEDYIACPECNWSNKLTIQEDYIECACGEELDYVECSCGAKVKISSVSDSTKNKDVKRNAEEHHPAREFAKKMQEDNASIMVAVFVITLLATIVSSILYWNPLIFAFEVVVLIICFIAFCN